MFFAMRCVRLCSRGEEWDGMEGHVAWWWADGMFLLSTMKKRSSEAL